MYLDSIYDMRLYDWVSATVAWLQMSVELLSLMFQLDLTHRWVKKT